MNNNLERAVDINMTNVAVIGAIQSAMLRTLVARKIVTAEMWDSLFEQAAETLRAQAAERPHEGKWRSTPSTGCAIASDRRPERVGTVMKRAPRLNVDCVL